MIDLGDLLALDLEYRLTIAMRMGGLYEEPCECVRYFIERREVLLPAIMKKAGEQGRDPVEMFAEFARGVHARHEEKSEA